MNSARKYSVLAVTLPLFFAWHSASSFAQSGPATETRVVMLGTGTPLPDPQRSGPSTAIVVNDAPYIVDAGAGVVRRAAAARDKGVKALEPTNLRVAFLTHLHADHTLGLPDLMITPWIMGRKEPGVIFKDANVTVVAFAVQHGNVNAYGYRFAALNKTIVITGDTSPTGASAENCHGCDILISEAYTKASFDLVSPEWQRYRLAFHTSAQELGAIATKAKPGLLILYHRGNAGCDQARTQECRDAGSEENLLKELHEAYSGKVAAAHDLDVF